MTTRRDELVETHLDLVRQLATRIARRLPPSFELDDLVQQGCLGLLQAAERYDSGKNSSFEAYARPRIKGAILDSIRRRHWCNGTLLELSGSIESAYWVAWDPSAKKGAHKLAA